MGTKRGRVVWLATVAVIPLGLPGFQAAVVHASDTSFIRKDTQRRADEIIRSQIEKRLRMDDRIAWELLRVEIVDGHATLYGEVRTPEEKGLAALIASTVPGVRGLTNSILVEPATTRDHSLSKAVWNVLHGVPTLSANDTLRVNVKNAVVKLEGSVAHAVQREAAEKAAQSVPGVAIVINLIEVNRTASGENILENGREKMLQEGVEVQP